MKLFVWLTVILVIQWKQLNVITMGQMETDKINQMITRTGCFYIGINSQ